MKSLSNDWITEGLIDVEYKTYVLLAYLAEVKQQFNDQKIYPGFTDLLNHYQNVLSVKTGRENLKKSFPKMLSSADMKEMKLNYEETVKDNDFFEVMDAIIEYSIPTMKKHLEEGKGLYQFVEENLSISTVGIQAPTINQGYFFLFAPPKLDSKIYKYNLTQVHLPDGNYRALHVSHLSDFRLSFTTTFESVKSELIRSEKSMPGFSTYLIESDVFVPWEESLLPVAKRRLVEFLARESLNPEGIS